MATERPPHPEAGFTLIEVLAAMVILAVGLLGLEALGISAARSIVIAERQSRFAATATRYMETEQAEIRLTPAATLSSNSCGADDETGHYVCTVVETRTGSTTVRPHEARVTVRVSKAAGEPAFTVISHVFHPALP